MANVHASHSVNSRSLRGHPFRVLQTIPLIVKMRTRTPAQRPAIIPSRPALGVCVWTMSGRIRSNNHQRRTNEIASDKGAISRFMGIA